MSDDIAARAVEHDNLLRAIEAVDYAPPTLKQVQEQLKQSQKRLEEDDKKLKAFEAATKKEYKEWIEIRDRTHKRIWTKISHPRSNKEILSSKEQKEEKEYLDAFAEEHKLRAEKETLDGQIEEMEGEIKSLTQLAREHTRLRNELMRLYDTVFGGPTPMHPEEDQAEQAYKAALEEYNKIQGEVTNESRAFALLQQADRTMILAARSLAQAEDASQWDMFGGGAMMDMMERSALADAQRQADTARMLVGQARELQPAIPGLRILDMPQGNLMSDVFFDNIFTDYAFHQKIQGAVTRSRHVHEELRKVCGQSQGHLNALKERGRQAEAELNSTRKRLEEIRKEIMQRAGEPLPTYQPRASGPPPPIDAPYHGNPFADALAMRTE
ncbi:hypothetical protein QFC22_005309 [Naganishia vaughanmartiniae]|uniref:Uncharacterized protein n=1 Tax=Naganishia vaughanmartiniae TaxID=1424756 RepID=A0ACC2WU89_9TREE|nr:hypothetical protein QFC22_005309 [Naganishia vaughanmartiniae]